MLSQQKRRDRDLSLPLFFSEQMWIAFLLRRDPKGEDVEDPLLQREFLMWWLCYGRFEYGLREVTAEQRSVAWELVDSSFPNCGRLPRLVEYVLRRRTDVIDASVGKPADHFLHRCIIWFLRFGYKEMLLSDVIGEAFLSWLSQPVAEHGKENATRLADFLWGCHPELQSRFPKTEAGLSAAYLKCFREIARIDCGLGLFTYEYRHGGLGVNLIGYAYGDLGIGEDVRMVAGALDHHTIPYTIKDFSDNLQRPARNLSVQSRIMEETPFSINFFCLTGFDTGEFYLKGNRAIFDRGYNIGYWPWELPAWPKGLSKLCGLVDEIWTSSSFTQKAFQSCTAVPVYLMPMAVGLSEIEPFDRRRMGISDDQCLFLYIFDGNSYVARKNPCAALRAFREAFDASEQDTKLIIKVMNSRKDHPEWESFWRETAEDSRIIVIDEVLSRPSVLGLIQACDVYVSLHRAEGFGRTIAEAMLLGKPVVATDWSGSTELIGSDRAFPVPYTLRGVGADDYPWANDATWAEPDVQGAAVFLKLLKNKPDLRRDFGERGRAFVRANHGFDRVGKMYLERLRTIRHHDRLMRVEV